MMSRVYLVRVYIRIIINVNAEYIAALVVCSTNGIQKDISFLVSASPVNQMDLAVNGQVDPPDWQLHQSLFLGRCKSNALSVNKLNLSIESVHGNAC